MRYSVQLLLSALLGFLTSCKAPGSEPTPGDSTSHPPVPRPTRVLYVQHPPTYQYRFLKNALIRDPEILAHCFLTSADEGFPQEHTRGDDPLFRQPLRRFPADLKSLAQFDVIIYGDVDPAVLGEEAARNIDRFVRELGRGVIFISSHYYFNPEFFAKTPLGKLLPVMVDDKFSDWELIDRPYTVTEEGRDFFPFNFDAQLGPSAWVPWLWYVVKARPKEGATVLVRAGPDPLFVTRKAGAGRVFWCASEDTWAWRQMVGDYPLFYPFWKRSITWAAWGR